MEITSVENVQKMRKILGKIYPVTAQKGVLIPLQGLHSSPPGSSRDPLLSPERVRSPTPLEYVEDDEPMKEIEPDWTEWVPNPYLTVWGSGWLRPI